MVVAAAEVVVGLAIIVTLYRNATAPAWTTPTC
jgi:NADH:ubiquinone oxidoreductase subunit K